MGSLFKSGPNRKDVANATPFGQTPAFQQQAFQEYIQRGKDYGLNRPDLFTPIGFSPEQQAALEQLQSGVQAPLIGRFNFGQRASGEFDRAGDILNRFDPTLTTALSSIQAGQAPITGQQLQTGIGDFMNPFTSQVINPAIEDVTQSAQRRLSELEGRASGNLGAFGGARTGIEAAEIQRGLGREVGRLSGTLRSDAYKTAAEQALSRLTGERERALNAGQLGLGALGQIATGAGQATGLGSNLFDARRGIEQLRTDIYNRDIGGLKQQIAAGDILRQLQQQQQQAPLTQLDYLGSVATASPGVGAGQLPQRQSIASQMGQLAQGIGSIMGARR